MIVGAAPQQDASDDDDRGAQRDHYPRPDATGAHNWQRRTVDGREIYVFDHQGRLGVKAR